MNAIKGMSYDTLYIDEYSVLSKMQIKDILAYQISICTGIPSRCFIGWSTPRRRRAKLKPTAPMMSRVYGK